MSGQPEQGIIFLRIPFQLNGVIFPRSVFGSQSINGKLARRTPLQTQGIDFERGGRFQLQIELVHAVEPEFAFDEGSSTVECAFRRKFDIIAVIFPGLRFAPDNRRAVQQEARRADQQLLSAGNDLRRQRPVFKFIDAIQHLPFPSGTRYRNPGRGNLVIHRDMRFERGHIRNPEDLFGGKRPGFYNDFVVGVVRQICRNRKGSRIFRSVRKNGFRNMDFAVFFRFQFENDIRFFQAGCAEIQPAFNPVFRRNRSRNQINRRIDQRSPTVNGNVFSS